MNNWILYQVLGVAIYTVVNFTDKYILERQIKDYRGFAIFSSIVGLIAGTLLWVIFGFPFLGTVDGMLVILTGVLSIFGAALYFQMMQQEQASKVIFLMQLTPVFVLFGSFLFLREMITLRQLLGFVLILVPTIAVSLNFKDRFSLKPDKLLLLAVAFNLFWSTGVVLFKFVSETGSFIRLAIYESWGWAIGGAILFSSFPVVRRIFIATAKSLNRVGLTVVFGNEVVYLISKLLTFLAIVYGPVFLVSALGGLSVFFGIIYGWILTLIAPKIFGEDTSKEGLLKKLF